MKKFDEIMSTIKNWYIANCTEITWFLMGWLTLSCIDNLARGHYFSALVDAILVMFNYSFTKR